MPFILIYWMFNYPFHTMNPFVRFFLVGLLHAVYAAGVVDAQDVPIDTLLERGAYAAAAEQLEKKGDRESLILAGNAWIEIDSTERALRDLRQATMGEGGEQALDSLTGMAFHKMGVAAYNAYDDSLAIVYYRQAIAVRDRVLPRFHNERAHTRANLAGVLNLYGRVDTAIVLLREANTIFENVTEPDSLNWLRNLVQLGIFAEASRNYRLGYSSSFRAVSLLQEMDVSRYDAFITYYQAAQVLLRLDELSPALEYAGNALEVARKTGEDKVIADAYNMLAIVEREIGHIQSSYQNLRQAEYYANRSPDTASLGIIYLNLAEYYGGEDDRDNMEKYDRLAREYLSHAGKIEMYYSSEKVPAILLRWGQQEAALSMLDERLAYLTEGRIQGPPQAMNKLPPANMVPVIDLLGHRATAYAALGQPDKALADYRALFALQDRLRQAVSDSDSRGFLSKDQRRFYDRAISLLLEAYATDGNEDHLWEAFSLSERARAYSLLASVQANYQRIPPTVRELQQKISRLERRVSLGEADRREDLAAARIKMDRLQVPEVTPPPADFEIERDELEAFLLENNSHLLQYHLAPEGSVVFLFGPEGNLAAFPITRDSLLSEQVHSWRSAIARSSYRRKSVANREEQIQRDREYLETGLDLGHQLLPAALRESLNLRAAAPDKRPRLCIVPDGVLNYLPFAALPLAGSDLPLDYKSVPYLHTAADLTYTYSANYLLKVSQENPREYERNMVAFAPSFQPHGEALADTRSTKSMLRSNATLDPLVYSKKEVRAISDLVPHTQTYFDEEADREHFVASLGTAQILHLSSHGSVDPTDPNLSFVAFSQSGDSLQKEQLLYFNDLYGLPINNELTVLSACETAMGQLAVGETTMSFASAFAAAGARSTLTTLWQVDDEATKDLVVNFYRRLVKGESRLIALNGAQSDLREAGDYAHPYYWSGMTLYGASGTLDFLEAENEYMPDWAWAIVIVLVVGALGAFLYIIRAADANLNPAT